MNSSHPGKPIKQPRLSCPQCNDHATTLQTAADHDQISAPYTYCPNCGWREEIKLVVFADDIADDLKRIEESGLRLPASIEETYARAVGEVEPPLYLSDATVPQEMAGGMAHSVGTPSYHLIPSIALIELANQYALGESIKGKDAWNAFSDNQHVLLNKEALAIRLGHVISHSLSMLGDLVADKPLNIRDAAAIMWGGSFAICATDAVQKAKADSVPTGRV